MINTNVASSDNKLFESIQQDNQLAFTIVYRKYWKPLYLVAYHRLNQKEIAEELVQELFVKFWKKRQELQVAHLEHYLLRSIKFAVIDYIRPQAVQGKFDAYYQTFDSLEDCETENLSKAVPDVLIPHKRNTNRAWSMGLRPGTSAESLQSIPSSQQMMDPGGRLPLALGLVYCGLNVWLFSRISEKGSMLPILAQKHP